MSSILSEITEVIGDLLIFVAVMTILLIALLVIVARRRASRRIKHEHR